MRHDRVQQRLAEPAGLIYYLGRWHFIAWCRLRNAYRDFRTDRISQLKLLSEVVDSRESFNARDFIRQSMPDAPLQATVSFTPVAADRAKREWWQGVSGEVYQADTVQLTLNCSDWRSLASWLLSLGNSATVLAPAELIAELRQQSLAHGLAIEEAQIKLFGGSKVLPLAETGLGMDVGQRNIALANCCLREAGLQASPGDVGGSGHRRVRFDLHTGDVWVRRGATLDRSPFQEAS